MLSQRCPLASHQPAISSSFFEATRFQSYARLVLHHDLSNICGHISLFAFILCLVPIITTHFLSSVLLFSLNDKRVGFTFRWICIDNNCRSCFHWREFRHSITNIFIKPFYEKSVL
uniref:Uncharacterized protein n=1 Tax=Parascaris univalens TaxID=6257 RepID=A0A915AJ93_PARUN